MLTQGFSKHNDLFRMLLQELPLEVLQCIITELGCLSSIEEDNENYRQQWYTSRLARKGSPRPVEAFRRYTGLLDFGRLLLHLFSPVLEAC